MSTIWDDMRSIAHEEWRRDAACSHSPDLRLWDASVEGETPDRRKQRHEDAKTICASCPVRNQCRAAVDKKKDSGIRDGELLPAFREVTGGKGPGPREIKHGTEGGYVTHLRRHEKACQACKIAADDARKKREKRAAG